MKMLHNTTQHSKVVDSFVQGKDGIYNKVCVYRKCKGYKKNRIYIAVAVGQLNLAAEGQL